MNHIDRLAYLIAGTATAAGVFAFAPISGELDPPDGPVADTTPSLAELLATIQINAQDTAGEWQTVLIAPRTGSADQPNAIELLSGRVQVRRTTVLDGAVTLFDEPGGEVNANGLPLSVSGAVHQNYSSLDDGADSDFNLFPSQLDMDFVFEDGVYAAYQAFGNAFVLQVEYRELDD